MQNDVLSECSYINYKSSDEASSFMNRHVRCSKKEYWQQSFIHIQTYRSKLLLFFDQLKGVLSRLSIHQWRMFVRWITKSSILSNWPGWLPNARKIQSAQKWGIVQIKILFVIKIGCRCVKIFWGFVLAYRNIVKRRNVRFEGEFHIFIIICIFDRFIDIMDDKKIGKTDLLIVLFMFLIMNHKMVNS